MAKASREAFEADAIDAEEIEEISESQPLRTLSHEAPDEDVEDFATGHRLTHKLEVLRKAALLLHDGSHSEDTLNITPIESQALSHEKSHKWRQPRLLYLTISVCSLGAIEQGWAQTGMNGANLYISNALGIDTGSTHGSFVLGLINCSLFLGQASFGSFLSGPINDRIGRRGAIFLASALCLIGNLGCSISWSWIMLVFSRLILGMGLGLNASSINVYAAECAPAYIRGGLAVSWQMFTAFGILLGFLANVAFHDFGPNVIWRWQLAAPLVPTVPLLLMIYLCPESPAWQVKRGRYDLAFASLARLRNTELQAAAETYSSHFSRANSKEAQLSYTSKIKSLFTVPRNRHALYASYTVMLSQQLCGINIIAFYSSTIFSSSGFSTLAALWASVAFGLVNFLGAIPAIWSMDAFGRRGLMLWTLPAMALTMALTGLSFGLPKGTAQFVILAALIYLFCLLYSPGVGPVPCAYSAEVYPLDVRDVGMSFAVFTASSWATILSLTFPALLDGLGERGSFGLYAVLNVLAWALCWAFVRETKGVRLEEMDAVFEGSAVEFVKERWFEPLALWKGKRAGGRGWKEVVQHEEEEEQ